MYVEDFDAFYQQAEKLLLNDPIRTRYVVKYRHTAGQLVLKVTDDDVCLKYKTDQQVDIRKMEKLNALFFAVTATGQRPSDEALAAAASAEQLGSQAAPAAAAASKGRGGGSKSRRKG